MHRLAILVAAPVWLFASPSRAQLSDYFELGATTASRGRSLRAALPPIARARTAFDACGATPAFRSALSSARARFTIGVARDGSVDSFRLELPEGARDASWLACLEAAVRAIHFAPARASTSITGWLTFVSPGAAALLALAAPSDQVGPMRRRMTGPHCPREASAVRAAEGQLRRARSDALRDPLRARLAAAERALSECQARGLGSLGAPEVSERRAHGRVTLEDGDAVGGESELDPAFVVRILRSRLAAARSCYERRLRDNPTLSGRVTVAFAVSPAGTVPNVSVAANTSGDSGLADCVTEIVRRLRIDPGPEATVQLQYPFRFEPSE